MYDFRAAVYRLLYSSTCVPAINTWLVRIKDERNREVQATKIQAGLQGLAVRKMNAEDAAAAAEMRRRTAAAKTIQGAMEATGIRATVAYEKEEIYSQDATVIEAAVRGAESRLQFRLYDESAQVLQGAMVGGTARAPIRELRRQIYRPAAVQIQALMRGKEERSRVVSIHDSSRVLQGWVGNKLERQRVEELMLEEDSKVATPALGRRHV